MSSDKTRTVLFDVDGMTCFTCAIRVERIRSGQEGVDKASVNLAGASAALELLNPTIAAAAMAFSSVSVVFNALRLKLFDPFYLSLPTTQE